MKIKIRLSEKLSECPNLLKGLLYHFGCKSENAWRGFIQDFTPRTTCHFNELEFLPEEELLQQSEWVIEAQESESVAVLLINGRPVAATIHSQIRGSDGGITGKADLTDQCIGGFLKSLPAEIRHIGIFSCDLLEDLAPLSNRADLLTLSLAHCRGVRDISPLRGVEKIQLLDLTGLERLISIDSFSNSTSLQRLILDDCRAIEKIDSLAACKNLELLNLSTCREITSIDPLRGLANLKNLNLYGCSKVRDFSPVASLTALEELKISGISGLNNFEFLAGLKELRGLDISRWPAREAGGSGTHLNFLSKLTKLQTLSLERWERLEDISSLGDLKELEHLDIVDCSALKDLSPLSVLPKLASIGISGCKSLKDFSPLSKIPKMKSLSRFRRLENHADLRGCEALDDLQVISTFDWISDLNLSKCRGVSDLTPLSRLQNLESLDLEACAAVSNLAPLAGLVRLKKLNLQGCKRLKSLEPIRNIISLTMLDCDFHPAQAIEILAQAAWRRRDITMILKHGWAWGKEAMTCEKQGDSELEKLVTTLCAAFALLGESKLARPLENLLGRHPEFSSAPWQAWFGETFTESGFDLYRQRVERVPVSEMLPGAIGGACATLPYDDNADWSRQWLATLEKTRLSNAKNLVSVAPEICLAHARLGLSELLHSWLLAFTDPSDPSALDPVHAALARYQVAAQKLDLAESHIFSIVSPNLRDPVIADLIIACATSNPDRASAHLLLIESPSTGAEVAKKLASQPEFSTSEIALHRLVVAMGDSPEALSELINSLPQSSTESRLIQKISESLRLDRKSTLHKIAEELQHQLDHMRAEGDAL